MLSSWAPIAVFINVKTKTKSFTFPYILTAVQIWSAVSLYGNVNDSVLVLTAAVEAVSRIQIKTLASEGTETEDEVDVRFVELPFHKDQRKDSFDPRDYRTPRVKIHPWMAYFNLIRMSVGAGLMAIPLAVSQAGMVVGPILCVSVGVLFMHTHEVLLWCMTEIARQLHIPRIAYRFGFRVALLHGPPLLHGLGRRGPCIVATFMIMSQIGICTLFVIFTADNLRDIMDWEGSEPALLCLLLPYTLMQLFMKNFRVISFVSMAGNVLNVIALVLVAIEMCLKDPTEDIIYYPKGMIPLLFALGILFFNMSAVGVCLACERALENPKIMTDGRLSVVKVGFLVPAALSTVFGVLGYYSFGSMEENVLRYLPYDSPISQAAFGVFLLSVALSYPVQCHPAAQMVDDVLSNHDPLVRPSDSCRKGTEYVFRPIFVWITFVIAYLVPYQGPFVAFIGNLCTTLLVLVFPALMEIGIKYPHHYGPYNYILIKDILIILLGLTSWVFGIVMCGYLIYLRLLGQQEHN